MNLLQICGIGVLAAVLAFILKSCNARLAPFIGITAGVLLFATVITAVSTFIKPLSDYAARYGFSDMFGVALRAIGLGYLTEIGSGICRELGEKGLADAVSLAGRMAILLIGLPVFLEILELAVHYAE